MPDPNIPATILLMTDDLQYATIRLDVCDPAEMSAADGSPLAVQWEYHEGDDEVYDHQVYEIAPVDRRLLDWHRLAPDEAILYDGMHYRLCEILDPAVDACYYWERIKPLLLPANTSGRPA